MVKYDQSEPKLDSSTSALAIPTKEQESVLAEISKFKMDTKIISTFQLVSTDSLQFVVSKSLLNMTNKIVKSLEPIKEPKGDAGLDVEASLAVSRSTSLRKLTSHEEASDTEDEEEADANTMEQIEGLYDEKYEEIFVFNILVKNELGTGIQLKTLNKFKVSWRLNPVQKLVLAPINLFLPVHRFGQSSGRGVQEEPSDLERWRIHPVDHSKQ